MQIIHIPSKQLTREQVHQLIALQDVVWPKEEKLARPIEERIDEYINDPEEEYETFLIFVDDKLVAHAEIFARTVLTEKGPVDVMALASVCTPPECRGDGYGKRIVEEAFKQVDNGRFKVSLFQTGVPEFYEKFGACRVDNPFVNSRAEDPKANPWWNPYQMIYPTSFLPEWPEGVIDLDGNGY